MHFELKNGNWMYLLVLFDLKLNTIVTTELIDSETIAHLCNFLSQSLLNQNNNGFVEILIFIEFELICKYYKLYF